MSILYIVRGLPGSGKSTLARKLVSAEQHCEADQFFEQDGEYKFDPLKLKDAHRWCQAKVCDLLSRGEPCCVSNTFTRTWEYEPYVRMAQDYGYQVQVIECFGPWESIRGVPQDTYDAMKARWSCHGRRELPSSCDNCTCAAHERI